MSHALALIQSSPYWWRDWAHATDAEDQRRDTFIEQALRYATYDDLPGDLKATYDAAMRARQAGDARHATQRHSEHSGHHGHRRHR